MKNEMSCKKTWSLMKDDIDRRRQLEGISDCGWGSLDVFLYRGVWAVILFRLMVYAYYTGHRLLARIIHDVNLILTKTEIDPLAQIEGGLVLPDIGMVGIPRFAIIGRDCTVSTCVLLTIGGIEGIDLENDRIIIRDGCSIGPGVMILGPIVIAENVQIEANAVLIRSVDTPGVITSGIPARRRSSASVAEVQPRRVSQFQQRKNKVTRKCIRLSELLRALSEDVDFRCEYEQKQRSISFLLKLIFNLGFLSVALFRVQQFFDSWGLRPLGWLFNVINHMAFCVFIDSGADIAGGFLILHPMGVIIDANVRIESKVVIFSFASITPLPAIDEPEQGQYAIIIGENTQIGTGARIIGNLRVGNGARIGVNTVVKSDVPPDSVAFGVPARIVASRNTE